MNRRPLHPQINLARSSLLSLQRSVKYILENYPQTRNNFKQFINNQFWTASLYGARRFGVRDEEIDLALRKTEISRFLPRQGSRDFSYLHTEKERATATMAPAFKTNCEETLTYIQNFDPNLLVDLPQDRVKEIVLAWIEYQRGTIEKMNEKFNQIMYEARKLVAEPEED